MDGNFSEMLKEVLADPEAMEKLMGAAETLMGEKSAPQDTGASQEAATVGAREGEGARPLPVPKSKKDTSDERIALLTALRPYLSPERRKSADNLIRMMKMMKMTDLKKLFPL